MSEQITKGELVAKLTQQWGGTNPFVFQTKGLPPETKFDVDNSVIRFTCCNNPNHGEMSLSPKEILGLKQHNGGYSPCPTCAREIKENLAGLRPEDMPLPGEEVSSTILVKDYIAPDDPKEREKLMARLDLERQMKENREKAEQEKLAKLNPPKAEDATNSTVEYPQELVATIEVEQAKEATPEQTSTEDIKVEAPVTPELIESNDDNPLDEIPDEVDNDISDVFDDEDTIEVSNEISFEGQSSDNELPPEPTEEQRQRAESFPDKIEEQQAALGYYPWSEEEFHIEIDDNSFGVQLTCLFCGNTHNYTDMDYAVSVVNDIGDDVPIFHPCPSCVASMEKAYQVKGKHRNTACLDHLNQIVKENFDGTMIILTNNLFTDPTEKIRFKNAHGIKFDTSMGFLINVPRLTEEDNIPYTVAVDDETDAQIYAEDYPGGLKDICEIIGINMDGGPLHVKLAGTGEIVPHPKHGDPRAQRAAVEAQFNTEDAIINDDDVQSTESIETIDEIPEITNDNVSETINDQIKINEDIIIHESKEDIVKPIINHETVTMKKKTKEITTSGGLTITIEVDDEDSSDLESENVEQSADHTLPEISVEDVKATIKPTENPTTNNDNNSERGTTNGNVVIETSGGLRIEVTETSPSRLGKSKPHENNRGRDLSGVTLADDPTHEDHLRSHINEQKKEEREKWYNKKVFKREDEETINELIDDEDLYEEFNNSKLGILIKMVNKRTEIPYQIIISEQSYDIPIVDFNTGVRVVCIDANDEDQMRVPIDVEKNVPFRFNMTGNERIRYRRLFLYSDSVNTPKRFKASLQALSKIVNRDKFDTRRIINITGKEAKYDLFYTDDKRVIDEFEEKNSPNAYGKPNTHKIGIIALRNAIERKQKYSTKDILDYFSKNSYKFDMKNLNLYIILSARYIVQPNPVTQTVTYTITDYVENGATIIKDGLDVIIAAIMKEHLINYPTYRNSNFVFEFDPASLPSPSLEILDDAGDLIPTTNMLGYSTCFIRKADFRKDFKDSYRQDERYFTSAKTLSKKFELELKTSGLNITFDRMREKFIESLGFVKFFQPKIKQFMINPLRVMKSQFDTTTIMMNKIDISQFYGGTGIYEGGYDKVLMRRTMFNMLQNNDSMDKVTKSWVQLMFLNNFMKN